MTTVLRSSKTRAALAIASAGAMVAAGMAAGLPTASAKSAGETYGGLDGPRGVAIAQNGKLVVAQADGTISRIVRRGSHRGDVVKIGKVPDTGLAPSVDINKRGHIFALTTDGEHKGRATLFRFASGHRKMVANIGKYQKHDPDPFDLEDNPTESNPYGVAALDDGAVLVADAAGNDLLRVRPNGNVRTVARVKPRMVTSPDLGPEGPPAGTRMPTEAVVTSVTVGSDGFYYIGELRGFPGNPGKSQIWRIRPGAKNAVCNPARPNKGACKRHADGLTSVVDLGAGPHGTIYALELSKMGWLAMEMGTPGAEIGALIKLGRNTSVRRELAEGQLVIPGGLEVDKHNHVWATMPMFGPGAVMRVN